MTKTDLIGFSWRGIFTKVESSEKINTSSFSISYGKFQTILFNNWSSAILIAAVSFCRLKQLPVNFLNKKLKGFTQSAQ